jgi:peptide deformylase
VSLSATFRLTQCDGRFFALTLLMLLIPFIGYSQKANKFSRPEKKLIKGEGMMRVLTINNLEDSFLLRKPSFDIKADSSNKKLLSLIDRMIITMTDSSQMGVGIAAPQVGVLRNVIIVQRLDKPDAPIEAYVNPKIISCNGEKIEGREGCLSIPNRSEMVFRQQDIELEYADWDGGVVVERITGFTSVIFQHEIDHLNGILYIDHLAREE